MSRKKTYKSDYFLFAKNISKIADDNGGKYAFADALGVVYDSVRRWCNGENLPDGQIFFIIRNKFGVSVDWLLAGENPEPVYLTAPEQDRPALMVADQGSYGISAGECPVKCDDDLRELCRRVKYIIDDNGEFAEALKANIKAFKKSVELDRRVKNLEQSLSSGSGGGIPQAPARSTAKRRRAV